MVGFVSILPLPHPIVKNAWREHRTVILPDFQGISLGCKLSDYFGSLISSRNGAFYSRTQNPAIVSYRSRSKNWILTKKGKSNKQSQNPDILSNNTWKLDFMRIAYSFKYVGLPSSEEEGKLFWEK